MQFSKEKLAEFGHCVGSFNALPVTAVMPSGHGSERYRPGQLWLAQVQWLAAEQPKAYAYHIESDLARQCFGVSSFVDAEGRVTEQQRFDLMHWPDELEVIVAASM